MRCTAGMLAFAAACGVEAPIVVPEDPAAPFEVRPGIFRLTFNRRPDLHPGWLDSVTVAYRTKNLLPYDTTIVLFARSIHGGVAVPVEPRSVVEFTAVRQPVSASGRPDGTRQFGLWVQPILLQDICPPPCPAPPTIHVTAVRVDAASGPGGWQWTEEFARIDTPQRGDTIRVLYRIVPPDSEALVLGRNPFGPAWSETSRRLAVSDGESVLVSEGGEADPLTGVTSGAYPALSAGGRRLAFTRFVVTDSVTTECVVQVVDITCIQNSTSYSVERREIWVRDLATGDEQLVTEGDQAVFDPAGDRLLVARAGGLNWVALGDGAETPIPNTAGAHSPAVSPVGRYVAFVAEWEGQPDVYFMALNR